jgi:hypothetical protein
MGKLEWDYNRQKKIGRKNWLFKKPPKKRE